MRTDFERAWGLLRDRITQKRSHGQAELLLAMAETERECRVEQGERAQFARLFGDDMADAFRNTITAAEQPLDAPTALPGRRAPMPATPRLPTEHGAEDDPAGRTDHPLRRAG